MSKDNYMYAQVLEIAGLKPALTGMLLSYSTENIIGILEQNAAMDVGNTDARQHADTIANHLASHNNGENKFLRFVSLWILVRAPRYWWQEFDTYKVGAERLSQSTMHTITKRHLIQDDFCEFIPEHFMQNINHAIDQKDWLKVKRLLPESFLQTRMVWLNAAALQNIYRQRRNHRLPEWSRFFEDVFLGLPEQVRLWITGVDKSE
ncbi:MAG: hypothetical protein WC551_11700 [Patescibacteria group bacterium]